MRLEISSDGVLIGTAVRSGPRTVYGYSADGRPIGCFGDVDAVIEALMRLLKVAA